MFAVHFRVTFAPLPGFCCAECPERIPALGFQCGAQDPVDPPKVHEVVRRHYNTVYHAIPENHYVKADAGKLSLRVPNVFELWDIYIPVNRYV